MNHIEKFDFTSKQKTFFLSLIALGAISMVLTYILEPGRYPADLPAQYKHTQFWTNLLHNSFFFTGIAFSAVLFIATHTLAWGGWHTAFKRVPEAMMTFLPIGALLLLIVWAGTKFGLHGIYLWNDAHALQTDKLVIHKSTFLNNGMYFAAVLVVLLWFWFAYMFRKLSIKEDGGTSTYDSRLKYAAGFLPVAGFSSAFVIWQVLMSIDVHWYSTMFAWYSTASVFVSCVSLIVLMLLYFKRLGYFPNVSKEHFHDLGKYVFGFSVFWTYLWFSQFMLIWYANNGEETQYFHFRYEQFYGVFMLNILINFVLPFAILLMNSSKRTYGVLGFAAGLVLLGHWLDFFQIVKPGAWHNVEHAYHELHKGHDSHGSVTPKLNPNAVMINQDQHGHGNQPAAHGEEPHGDQPHSDAGHGAQPAAHDDHAHGDAHAGHDHGPAAHAEEGHADHGHAGLSTSYLGIHVPGPFEIGTFLGFLGLFLYVTFAALSRASLVPHGDTYKEESDHHMTGVHDSFLGDGHH